MTDKIAIEVEAYEEGVLLKRYIEADESAPVNSIIAYIGEVGEVVPENQPTTSDLEKTVSIDRVGENESTTSLTDVALRNTSATKKIRATPAARKEARKQDLDLAQVNGTGPKGRIQSKDIHSLIEISEKSQSESKEKHVNNTNLIPWSGMRKVIADNMLHSYTSIPHVTMTAEVDLTKVVSLRTQLLPEIEQQTSKRLSYLEIIIKAVTIALKQYPIFNAHALTEGIQQFKEVNIGVAVALAEGLVVPVVKEASRMGLNELTSSVKTLTEKARLGTLAPAEMRGGTFTISSLGKTKVQSFTPIINTPEVAILGVGGLYETLSTDLYHGLEKIETVPKLNLCLSFDHRVADGAPAASFLSLIVDLLEEPMKLLL